MNQRDRKDYIASAKRVKALADDLNFVADELWNLQGSVSKNRFRSLRRGLTSEPTVLTVSHGVEPQVRTHATAI